MQYRIKHSHIVLRSAQPGSMRTNPKPSQHTQQAQPLFIIARSNSGAAGRNLNRVLLKAGTFQRTEKSTHSIYGAACNFTVRPGSSQRVNSTRRMRNPNMPFRKAYPTEFTDFHSAGLDKIISKIEALNPYTVRFVLHKALAP